MQVKKNELDKQKEERLNKIKTIRDGKFEHVRTNKSAIEERDKVKIKNGIFLFL